MVHRSLYYVPVYGGPPLAHAGDTSTVVLRKPGKSDYTAPAAYRPISLLNTLGRLLEAVVARRLSSYTEKYELLPDTQFGGGPGPSKCDRSSIAERPSGHVDCIRPERSFQWGQSYNSGCTPPRERYTHISQEMDSALYARSDGKHPFSTGIPPRSAGCKTQD